MRDADNTGSLLREELSGAPLKLVLANVGPLGGGDWPRTPTEGRGKSPTTPPGGILVLALLSGLSGAIAGIAVAGYLTVAFAAVASLAVGLAVGIWSQRAGG